MRYLTFAVDNTTGLVISRINPTPKDNQCVAWPVLQYEEFGLNGDFTGDIPIALEKFGIEALFHQDLTWTKKIPLEIKNTHRAFWGFDPLKV